MEHGVDESVEPEAITTSAVGGNTRADVVQCSSRERCRWRIVEARIGFNA